MLAAKPRVRSWSSATLVVPMSVTLSCWTPSDRDLPGQDPVRSPQHLDVHRTIALDDHRPEDVLAVRGADLDERSAGLGAA